MGVNASVTQDLDGQHRSVGLFAYKTLNLSRWMHAWISLGVSWEQWQGDGLVPPRQGATLGLSLGTTFR